MKIVGVRHEMRYFEEIDRYIQETNPSGIGTMMVELPANYFEVILQLRAQGRIVCNYQPFFPELTNRWKKRGTKIVYGDLPLDPERSLLWQNVAYVLDVYRGRKRDRHMEFMARNTSPDVIVVGRYHGDWLKGRFPESEYTTMDIDYNELDGVQRFFIPRGSPKEPDVSVILGKSTCSQI